MIPALVYIILGFLVIVSIIDWKLRQIPSILLTGMLFVVVALNPNSLFLGILGLIMAYFLYEVDFFGGIADIKVFTMISFMMPSLLWFFAFLILTGLFGIIWKVLIKWRIKKVEEWAFIPVFLFVFIAIWLLGCFA